jgi:hypothetical protein
MTTKCFTLLTIMYVHFSNFKQFYYFQRNMYQLLYIYSIVAPSYDE